MRRVAVAVLGAVLSAVVAVSPAAAGSADTTAPRVRFATADDAVVLGVPVEHDLTAVRGTATDRNGRGIRSVSVLFCGNAERLAGGGYRCGSGAASVGTVERRSATVRCGDARRRRCEWSVQTPSAPGRYLVVATATDRAGNQRSAGPIFVTVV